MDSLSTFWHFKFLVFRGGGMALLKKEVEKGVPDLINMPQVIVRKIKGALWGNFVSS